MTSAARQPPPEVLEHSPHDESDVTPRVRWNAPAAKTCARRRLVVRHLCGHPRAEEVRDLGHQLDARGDAGVKLVDLDAAAGELGPDARPCRRGATTRRRRAGRPRSARRRAGLRRTGRRRAPLPAGRGRASGSFSRRRLLAVDTPEEVVRRQEHQVSAEVAEAFDEVVFRVVTYSWWPAKTMRS